MRYFRPALSFQDFPVSTPERALGGPHSGFEQERMHHAEGVRIGLLWRGVAISGTLRRNHAGARIMLIDRIWAANSYRNFHYLIACPESGEALAVDPLEWRRCLDAAQLKGWQITQILNTHEHLGHTGGNAGLVAQTGARLLAHAGAAARIGGVDR